MTWLLIITALFPDTGLAMTQAGPFASEQECEAAGKKAAKELSGRVSFVCVQSGSAQ